MYVMLMIQQQRGTSLRSIKGLSAYMNNVIQSRGQQNLFCAFFRAFALYIRCRIALHKLK